MNGTERVGGAALESAETDTDRPTAARVYDYLLGGSHNFAADRALGDQIIASVPEAPMMAQANRAFLRRAVRYCLANGVRQFLDIGSGIPTLGNVHEVAHQADPEARVVYVDIDPVAVEHSRALLLGNDRAAVVHEDLRNPEAILHSAEVRALIDFDRPVALLLVAVLHFMPDEDGPHGIIKRFADAMAPGSLLVLSHGAKDAREDVAETATELYVQTRTPGVPRGRAEVERFFESFPPVEPGVVWAPLWRPDSTPRPGDDPARSCIYVGVGRKA